MPEKDKNIYRLRGIGCPVIVRPDQYVAHIFHWIILKAFPPFFKATCLTGIEIGCFPELGKNIFRCIHFRQNTAASRQRIQNMAASDLKPKILWELPRRDAGLVAAFP